MENDLVKIRKRILKRYKVGQEVKLRRRSDKDEIIGRMKVKIIAFYPYHVLTKRNGFRESFTYPDVERMTAIKKG